MFLRFEHLGGGSLEIDAAAADQTRGTRCEHGHAAINAFELATLAGARQHTTVYDGSLVSFSSPKTCTHSLKARLVVTIVERRS